MKLMQRLNVKKKKDGGETEIVITGIVRLCILILILMCESTEKEEDKL